MMITLLVVSLAHAWLTWSVSSLMNELQPGERAGIKRMEAMYTRELALTTPPAAPRPPSPPLRTKPTRKRALAPAAPPSAASQPAEEAGPDTEELLREDAPLAQAEAALPPEAMVSAEIPEVAPTAATEAPGAQPSAPAFVWPLATRVSFKLRGYYRGEVHGRATVEWMREDTRYQTRLEGSIGPSFAPIGSFFLVSEGDITEQGLSPRRFENANRLLVRTSPRRTVVFEPEHVVLDSGERVARQAGMQDAVSQFIQLSYRFMMNPGLLTPGSTIEVPLALPKKVEPLAYDVIGQEVLDTPLGAIPAVHLKPRLLNLTAQVLPAEIWFAPGLQYLPVRVLVHFTGENYLDMQMERAPEQAVTADSSRAR